MAYTTINKSTDHFNTKIYTGNGSTQSITGVGFQPDWVWIKNRSDSRKHNLYDAVRGVTKRIVSNDTAAEDTASNGLTAFGTDGFTTGSEQDTNHNGNNFVSWNWKAGGTAPAITYVVKVVSDSGNKYRFDDFGTSAVTLDLQEGGTYTFDQADSSNSGHPLRFYTAADKSGGEYTTGVTTNGTPGSSGAYTRITVAASAPTLYYQCSSHAGMGGQANTNSTFGSSNFSGSIQSTVSANTTAGFSIVSYTGNTTAGATVGHGLGAAPKWVVTKNLPSTTYGWYVYHASLGNNKNLYLHSNDSQVSGTSRWNDTTPTSSVFTLGTNAGTNGSANMIAYCFAEKAGYSKMGMYKGTGSTNGTFVYTGFKPAFVIFKRSDGGSENWFVLDNKRDDGMNPRNSYLMPNSNSAEDANNSTVNTDFLSNGFKLRATTGALNGSGNTYIYMAFAKAPLVGSNNVPTTAG
jgi:hypothetical protein